MSPSMPATGLKGKQEKDEGKVDSNNNDEEKEPGKKTRKQKKKEKREMEGGQTEDLPRPCLKWLHDADCR